MPNKSGKSHEQEKRAGQERRQRENKGLPGVERRNIPERRQTSISEISYFEWASHFVKFQGRRLAEKSASMADIPSTANDLS